MRVRTAERAPGPGGERGASPWEHRCASPFARASSAARISFCCNCDRSSDIAGPSRLPGNGRFELAHSGLCPPLAAARSAGQSRFRFVGTCGKHSRLRREQRVQATPDSKMHFTLARRQFVHAVLTGGWSDSHGILRRTQRGHGRWVAWQAVLARWQPLHARSVPSFAGDSPNEELEESTMEGGRSVPLASDASCTASLSRRSWSSPVPSGFEPPSLSEEAAPSSGARGEAPPVCVSVSLLVASSWGEGAPCSSASRS
mmetsp:Transcript_41675/g.138116  ORF Transcript_41675/g.138116 Transcript_41675/m.138116 type:complete len:258 (-) Transcript_41675:104-877(-)